MTTPTPKPILNCSRDDDWKRNDSAVGPSSAAEDWDEAMILRIFPSDENNAYFELIPRGEGPASWRDFVMDAAKEWHFHGEPLSESPEEAVWHVRITAEEGGSARLLKAPEGAWSTRMTLECAPGAFAHVYGHGGYEVAFAFLPETPVIMARVRARDNRPIAMGRR